ncbi:sacsin N-terminal ATP-binding-like domain-containing protein [Cellulomonas sp. 179-A 9B4 NHS]|uniref:DEAD/DEAH box helicase n=1 Tax=Cellulomonas sp. 179-A 9B4 NHS TaxID=3142379 RepID=UPI0039A2E4AB
MTWTSGDADLAHVVREQTAACLDVYARDPKRIEEDANNERRIAEGGYRDRQLQELMQNAVDAARNGGSRIEVRLSDDTLYVANDGESFSAKGVEAVMASDLSSKSDDRIGRFGIGFKSVLAATATPRVYSRSVSFAFDAEWTESTILEAGLRAPRYPVMRLARVLDPVAAAAADGALREMMAWASTVIVLPGLRSPASIRNDLVKYRSELLLFSPHVRRLRLRVDGLADHEATTRERPDGLVDLVSGDSTTTWRVLSTVWAPADAARKDGGRIADREKVRLDWALPVTGKERSSLGEFWAYFPTDARTTMTGIINAPWRLSDDRTNLLPGAFNRGLLCEVFPRLLASNVGELVDHDDPAAFLDLLPARGKESRSWADDAINQPVFDALRLTACVPDVDGRMHRPDELSIAPEGIDPEWVQEWSTASSAPSSSWVHPKALSTAERRLKVRRLVDPSGRRDLTAKDWLEALIRPDDMESCAAAIRLAARIVRESVRQAPGNATKAQLIHDLQSARIVPLEGGDLVRPVKGKVFIRTSATDDSGVFVDPRLVELPGVTVALAELGVTVLDKRAELETALSQARDGKDIWSRVWPLARQVTRDVAREAFEAYARGSLHTFVRVRTANGRWARLDEAFLGGTVVPTHGRRDAGHLIDPQFHASDVELLRELGAVSEPTWRSTDQVQEPWLTTYREEAKEVFGKANRTKVGLAEVVVEDRPVLWPLGFFDALSDEGRLEMTRVVLSKGPFASWQVRHATDRRLKAVHVQAPELWALRRHGLVDSSMGPMRPRDVLVRGEGQRADLFPVASDLSVELAEQLGALASSDAFSTEQWRAMKSMADRWTDDDRRFEFYTYLPGRLPAQPLVVRVGTRREAVAAPNIGVTSTSSVYEGMLEAQVPAMLVEDDDLHLFLELWGMHDGKEFLREEVIADVQGEAVYLTDEFPPLKNHPDLAPEHFDLELQRCTRIVRLVATPQGQVERPLAQRYEPGRVLVTATAPAQVLAQVSEALKLGMTAQDVQRVLAAMEQMRASQLKREVRKAARSNAELGLVTAVGAEALRSQVPRQALELLSENGSLAEEELARLVLSVHGVGVLKVLRSSLEERGLEPPREFSGRQKERTWVADLGFPAEWAGFPARQSPARETIDGPVELKPLHDYQERVTERIRSLLVGIGRQRGVVSLPTGAGKTRVAIQALVQEIANGRLSGPIVWIAQSDELCEQAAESWTYVWRALGPAPLVLGRLWGSNEVEEEPEGTQVIVATDAKLEAIIAHRADDYAWLREPTVVIVDEAHTSVSPRYTSIFDWLGRGARATEPRPLIGLTATPFRGTSDEETKRLVARYDGNLLDAGVLGEDPYRTLREKGVLAHVEKRTLDGATVDFTEAELAEIGQMRRFPRSREQQLGDDNERNRRIVESILDLPDDWPVLLFAPSVENARSIAALLSHRGVPSVSISGGTETSARRHYIDQFRKGAIRVLTNYQVLTQGFDAPAVKAVYVCRPTFSPNVYQQMVGRGLRGTLNGGSEKVLIVDVEDNLSMYGDQLAFRAFEKLWQQ